MDTAAGKGMMLTAADPYGYKVQYSYGSRAPYRVSKVTEYAGKPTTGPVPPTPADQKA